MIIWRNYKALSDASATLRKKNCWTACDHCKSKWSDIQPPTKSVHMVVRDVQRQTLTRFICDHCANDVIPIGTSVRIKGEPEGLGEIDAYRMILGVLYYVVEDVEYQHKIIEPV